MSASATKLMQEFREASPDKLVSMVTAGFELETQETFHPLYGEGRLPITKNSRVPPQQGAFNEAGWNGWVDAQVHAACVTWSQLAVRASLWPAGHPFRLLDTGDKWNYLFAAFAVGNNQTISEFIAKGLVTREAVEAYKAAVRASLDTATNRNQFRPTLGGFDWLTQNLVLPDIQVGTDGTVSGFEFRTLGGLPVERFKQAAISLMDGGEGGIRHKVAVNCSLHTHVAIPGVTHRWSERLAQAMTEFLINNLGRAPAGVKARWAAIGGPVAGNYFTPGTTDVKHSFVHKHPTHGTWEFRCFGNVNTSADAMTCLQLACEALQFAYQVLDGKHTLVADQRGWRLKTWQEACIQAMQRSVSLHDVADSFTDGAA